MQITEPTRDILKLTASSRGQKQKSQTQELAHWFMNRMMAGRNPSSQILSDKSTDWLTADKRPLPTLGKLYTSSPQMKRRRRWLRAFHQPFIIKGLMSALCLCVQTCGTVSYSQRNGKEELLFFLKIKNIRKVLFLQESENDFKIVMDLFI